MFFLPCEDLSRRSKCLVTVALAWTMLVPVGWHVGRGTAAAQSPSETANVFTETAPPLPTASSDIAAFRPRFDGKSLNGWEGDAEDDHSIPTTGVIGFQIHRGPLAEAWHCNVMIRTSDSPPDAD